MLFFSSPPHKNKALTNTYTYIDTCLFMAVEARHLNLFPPQILCNRDMVMMNETEGAMNVYGAGIGYGMATPLSATTTTAETLPPMYGSAITDSIPAAKTVAVKSDSGLTYAFPVTRKRSREDDVNINPLLSFAALQNQNRNRSSAASLTFLGEDMSFQIQQQQLEIDRFIAQHTEKVRMEIEERRKRYSTRIIAAVEQGIMKRLKAKEEEIGKMGKLNWALEERVKSLAIENQIWRDLAQTNEATANALRSNLEQVLAQVHDDQQQRYHAGGDAAALMDDAQSCCGSNYNEEIDRRTLADNVAESSKSVKDINSNGNGICGGCVNFDGKCNGISDHNNRLCRNCGKEEACVLLLPCRHLCLCAVCGSSLHTCPICKSTKNASLHVNMSF